MFSEWVKLNKDGKVNSNSIGKWICDSCGVKFTRIKKNHDKSTKNKIYNGRDVCRQCVNKFVNITEEYRHKQRSAQLMSYRLNPTRKERISKTLIANKINVGEKNGMKSLIARKKVSESRKNMSTENRKIYSTATRAAWKNGKYDGVKVGRCKWYAIQTPNGPMKVQGTWELKYAEYLMENNITFYAHRGRISYIDSDGVTRSYYPDFYLPNEDKYIDVKAPYFYKIQEEKFSLIKTQYPNLKLDVVEYTKNTNTWKLL